MSLKGARRRPGSSFLAIIVCSLWIPAEALPAGIPSDSAITAVLGAKLAARGLVGEAPLRLNFKNGLMTLQGSLPTLRAKYDALRAAEELRGVRGVADAIVVESPPRPDLALRKDVLRAIALEPAVASGVYDLAVSAGTVVVAGAAPSWPHRDQLRRVIESVPGVLSVDNQVRVAQTALRPDSEVAAEIETRLKRDAWLSGAPLKIQVSRGQVRVVGEVASMAQRDRLLEVGAVRGVGSVDVGDVQVMPGSRRTLPRFEGGAVSDGELAQAVSKAWENDPRLAGTVLHPAVSAGTITALGTVASVAQLRAALEDAENTVGNAGVRNGLVIPAGRATDERIAQAVRTAMRLNPGVPSPEGMELSVREGVVVISGKVGSRTAARILRGRLESLEGVRTVVSRLRFPPAPRPPTDQALRESVLTALRTDPLLSTDGELKVSVRSGVVTLAGPVDTRAAGRNVIRDALEAGAVAVEDRLSVRKMG